MPVRILGTDLTGATSVTFDPHHQKEKVLGRNLGLNYSPSGWRTGTLAGLPRRPAHGQCRRASGGPKVCGDVLHFLHEGGLVCP